MNKGDGSHASNADTAGYTVDPANEQSPLLHSADSQLADQDTVITHDEL